MNKKDHQDNIYDYLMEASEHYIENNNSSLLLSVILSDVEAQIDNGYVKDEENIYIFLEKASDYYIRNNDNARHLLGFKLNAHVHSVDVKTKKNIVVSNDEAIRLNLKKK